MTWGGRRRDRRVVRLLHGPREREGRAPDVTATGRVRLLLGGFDRQIRVEGPVTLAPTADVEAYWVTRPPNARVAAIATRQSRPIASRAALLANVERTTRELGVEAPRPLRVVRVRVLHDHPHRARPYFR